MGKQNNKHTFLEDKIASLSDPFKILSILYAAQESLQRIGYTRSSELVFASCDAINRETEEKIRQESLQPIKDLFQNAENNI